MRSTIIILLFLSLNLYAKEDWWDHHVVSWCTIYDLKKGEEIKTFPGENCLFLDDGSFISATAYSLKRFDKVNQKMWEIKGNFHHQMNLSEDKKKILTISSKAIPQKGHTLYDDEISIISLEGKILHQQLSSELLKQVGLGPIQWDRTIGIQKEHAPVKEITHLNTIYEIPSKLKKNAPLYIKDGGIIVNGLVSGVFLLSKNLKKVLHHWDFKNSLNHMIHDVQVLEDGSLLFFNNIVKDKEFAGNYSGIYIIDPNDQNILFEFTALPKGMFYSLWCGSVQILDSDHFFFTDLLTGAFIYSRKSKKLVMRTNGIHKRFGFPSPVLQAKVINLNEFFKNRPFN